MEIMVDIDVCDKAEEMAHAPEKKEIIAKSGFSR